MSKPVEDLGEVIDRIDLEPSVNRTSQIEVETKKWYKPYFNQKPSSVLLGSYLLHLPLTFYIFMKIS